MSSSASEQTNKIPLIYNLCIVNQVLDLLEISKIPKSGVTNSTKINKKIAEAGKKIRDLLKIKEPNKTTGEKVIEQFVEGFEKMDPADQYRVLTSMQNRVSQNNISAVNYLFFVVNGSQSYIKPQKIAYKLYK